MPVGHRRNGRSRRQLRHKLRRRLIGRHFKLAIGRRNRGQPGGQRGAGRRTQQIDVAGNARYRRCRFVGTEQRLLRCQQTRQTLGGAFLHEAIGVGQGGGEQASHGRRVGSILLNQFQQGRQQCAQAGFQVGPQE